MLMSQLPLFPETPATTPIVNVASVPQRSPFRYPGGKTWLVPRIRQWLASQAVKPQQFIEPFAGGGIVGLSVAFEQLAAHVTLVELDDQVASVWQTIIEDGEGEWLAGQIGHFELTPERVKGVLSEHAASVREQAFQTILRNRVNRGGILAPGAGKLNQAEGKGMAARWYPQTLQKRIRAIASIRDRLSFVQGDGLAVLRQYTSQPAVVFFIDPPYTAAGKKAGSRLYTHADLDHDALFSIAATLTGDFLMTYDDTETIRERARQYHFDLQAVPMKNTHHARLNELLIGRNLSWLR
jgi:DNA adenine methylase